MNMATPSSNRKVYCYLGGGTTSIDLHRVCAFTSRESHREGWAIVEFHVTSGSIFSCELTPVEREKLDNFWRYA